jgi:hypothetical protein
MVDVVLRSDTDTPSRGNDSSSSDPGMGNAVPIGSSDLLQEPSDDPEAETMGELWNENRGLITRLYIQEDKRLQEVRDIMRTVHSFDVSTRSYRQHFGKWGIGKDTASRGEGEQTDTRPRHSESIKRPCAQAKEVSDCMHRILTGAESESYWLPSPPLPPPDISSNNRR